MTRTWLVLVFGALLLSSAVGAKSQFSDTESARSDAGRSDPARSDAERHARTAEGPIVLAQTAQAAPSPPQQASPPTATPAPQIQSPYVASPQTIYMQDQQAVARINAQIEALMAAPSGGFAVQYYAKPAPPPPLPMPQGPQQASYGMPPGQMPPPGGVVRDRNGRAEKYVIARPGDTIYATLDRAFNSDDPQAPIFATIRDVDNSGVQGPLDGVRMVGNIIYSSSQGTIQFMTAYLPDGRPIQIKAIAVSEDTARTGIAKNVDTHDIERYGALLFSTLVQGAGQVGQTLLQNNQMAFVDPATGVLVSNQKVSPYQAGLAGLLPAGQALTAAAAQNFNKPATISGPAGMGLGIVFLDPVVVPRDVLFAR